MRRSAPFNVFSLVFAREDGYLRKFLKQHWQIEYPRLEGVRRLRTQ